MYQLYERVWIGRVRNPKFCRRCSIEECRFAHGIKDLRIPLQDSGSGLVGVDPTTQHEMPGFTDSKTSNEATPMQTRTNSPERSISCQVSESRRIISIDNALPRQRLDLFPHLDFTNELEIDGESLLSILSRELLIDVSDTLVVADGDDSPWDLPN